MHRPDHPYPVGRTLAAFHFYEADQEEIDQAIADNDIGDEAAKRLLPNLRLLEVAKKAVGRDADPRCFRRERAH